MLYVKFLKRLTKNKMIGSVFAWGGLANFFISYIRETDPEVTENDGFFIMPIMVLSNAVTIYFGAALEARFNPRL